MQSNPFLQEPAASRNKRQQLDHLLRVTAPHERVILAGVGLALLGLMGWVLFGTVVRTVTIDGVLIKPGSRHEVVSNEPGHLLEFVVAPGDRVKAGDAIARQSLPRLQRELAALRQRVDLLESGTRQTGNEGNVTGPLLHSARVALLQTEARRAARELIVSPHEGEVMTLRTAPGEFLDSGDVVAQVRAVEEAPLQAVLRVKPPQAHRIHPGMKALVEVAMPGGVTSELQGEVAFVTPGPLPRWLASLPPRVPDSAYRVDIVLRGAAPSPVRDGAPCRVSIVLGRHSPAALFDSGRS
ncbi:MAG: HlyD family efflux transporter periplasmic adaptor subunit [Deltaproteobacteria bacterium]|nr:HlyD family efflux transporter periplasmic adaptor subunit [Deltaproteobacteria bacterium]